MAALSGIQAVRENTGPNGRGKVSAATTIYEGAMVARDADGYIVPMATGLFFAGHALETVENTTAAGFGSDGDLLCKFRRGTYYMTVPVFSSATIANVGQPVWTSSDNHADLTLTDPTGGPSTTDLVGYVHDIDDDGNVIVKFVARNN
jgi:hypothetical protein